MKKIGRYNIRGLLGRGAMGKVYCVELPLIKKIMALKRLEPDPLLEKMLGPAHIRSLFTTEAMTLAKINHSNVVDVLDFDQIDGRLFYVMSYHTDNLGLLMGESYRVEKPSRIIPVEKAVNYTRQILTGLACLHYFDIIHRDIKPFNVLLTESETIKLCDFGLSKLRGETFKGPPNLNVGSPYYAPPEQISTPNDVDFNADLYAVGVILYRMLTGKLPLIQKHYIPASSINTDLDTDWDSFISKALAIDPKQRFQKADQMIYGLDQLYAAWKTRKEKVCAFYNYSHPHSLSKEKSVTLRSHKIKIPPAKAKTKFKLDFLWRPKDYLANQFVMADENLIEDRATGLVWQRSGSPYPLDWNQAHLYIEQLNQKKMGQKDDWQLPTIAQLCSLLTAPAYGKELCIQSIFDSHQKAIWSCDLRSYTAAWLVYLEMGFVSFQAFTGRYYVRAVSSSLLPT